jgi:SET domain-containing protein
MQNKKKKILNNLKKTYCRIKASKIDGVGVFAIQDIPEGTNPFQNSPKQKWQIFSEKDFKKLDIEIKKMISDFFGTDEKGNFIVPECGLNGMDISFFLNTSKNPNVKTIDDGANFITIKKIKKGKELTVSYKKYDARYR